MSIVKINAITVPHGDGPTLEKRFAARAGEVEQVDGFESFELLRPTDGSDRYLVVTRWRDVVAYDGWVSSDAFSASHGRSQADDPTTGHPGPSTSSAAVSGHEVGSPGEPSVEEAGLHGSDVRSPGAGSHDVGSQGPVGTASELWSFEVVVSAVKRVI